MEVKRAQLLARHHEAPHLLVGAKINNLRARVVMTKGGGHPLSMNARWVTPKRGVTKGGGLPLSMSVGAEMPKIGVKTWGDIK